MPSRLPCAFQLVRYVPDPVRNEFVHIGVLLREEGGQLNLRFTRDWRRVRCLDPDADTAMLEGMETELRRRLQEDLARPEAQRKFTRILDESLSLGVQITEPKAYLAESLPAGMEELMKMYVDPPKRERVSRLSGRAAIQSAMRDEFERAQVWSLMRKQIRAAEYTRPGDPLRIDAGYRPNGMIRMFHAVSLEPGVEMAKVLAFSSASLRTGVERIEKAKLELTAIVEPAAQLGIKAGESEESAERLELYRFGIETMEEHQIRVLTTTDLPNVAATARRELRLD
ncbi:DUF3037 domain-containing protein [Occallatibacter riparius]|uniref:DUF3037 domain-containing protein n=1 Tax=Occallatibacter riparius TaxID=1002689 RepID=A0A9J7BT44_9BACT|nr:DUF3037 domain-containing protein [Occallatibacter riparius]UWZ86044.1 DUF3037 domain-containing protein [Occallatibacter riparius]